MFSGHEMPGSVGRDLVPGDFYIDSAWNIAPTILMGFGSVIALAGLTNKVGRGVRIHWVTLLLIGGLISVIAGTLFFDPRPTVRAVDCADRPGEIRPQYVEDNLLAFGLVVMGLAGISGWAVTTLAAGNASLRRWERRYRELHP